MAGGWIKQTSSRAVVADVGETRGFVSSGSTVDRLYFLDTPKLAGFRTPWLSPHHHGCHGESELPRLYDDFRSIIFGIRVYKRALVTSAGKVTLVYFHNVVWDGHRMRIEPKPAVPHEMSTFAAYRTFLKIFMQLVTANLQSKSRKHSWQMRSRRHPDMIRQP